ncbi:MAG: type VI secretion system tip protein VgrG [Pseudomonadales bacterium]|jgi:type VI secretion system secreted protein VgrG|nr:type VI secretion system tip protein VgrG [Pseudomonadales bacterium]
MPISTKERLFNLSTPLGDDALLVQTFHGKERLSQPYEFKLRLLSERETVNPKDLLGKRATLHMETDRGWRQWTGLIATFEYLGDEGATSSSSEATVYACTVVPWLWFLSLHEDSRIFQEASIPQIVEAVFKEFNFADFEWHLDLQSGYYPELVYCVQYRETSLNFISRLLERAGIHYFFRHEKDREVLVLTDGSDRDAYPEVEAQSLRFHQEMIAEAEDTLSSLERRFATRTGRYANNDYDFIKPANDLLVSLDSLLQGDDNASYERYRHPGGYTERERGDKITSLEIEAEEAEHETLRGNSNVRSITPGYTFALEEHPIADLNEHYLIVAVTHEGSNNLNLGINAHQPSAYHNALDVIPLRVPYRPPLLTPRPRMRGPQTAVVTGPAAEEIYTDDYGRIKVHFFWDRRGKRDDRSSCWLRVVQLWAGNQMGAMFIPRVGHEVLVDFLDGDPDQPIVTGSVYNGENMPPYELPKHRTRSTLKTLSSKDGGGFNEIRFEDKKDEEQIFVHAQTNFDRRVNNNALFFTGNDEHSIIKRDHFQKIERHLHGSIDTNSYTKIGGDDHQSVEGMRTITINKSLSVWVDEDVGENFTGDHGEKVGGNYYLDSTGNVVIEALGKITLKVGGSFINVSAAGIEIQAPMVKINSGGAPGSGSMPTLEMTDPPDPPKAADGDRFGKGIKGQDGVDQEYEEPKNAENPEKKHYIEIELKDEQGKPVASQRAQIKLPNGMVLFRRSDKNGLIRVKGIDPGSCEISFPDLDDNDWKEA